ncbi:MAG: TonB-dependent siderophore receptor [Acetobacter okinawensis]|uniref:TonB-dependent siderophore receptor n=1 Tax=Acetobacter okinawensis TaxID=1076594 RepID=UPI0039E7C1B9
MTFARPSIGVMSLFTAGICLAYPLATKAETSLSQDSETTKDEYVEVKAKRSGYVAGSTSIATKTDVPLREVPQSVTVITRMQMDEQHARSISDALNYSAGVSAGSRPGSRFDSIYLRGFGGFGGSANYVQFLDGTRLTQGISYAVPSFDEYFMQSVEVLRGPASVLYGQSSPGGFVNMTMKTPTATPYHEVRLGTGSYDYGEAMLDMSDRINKSGTLSARLTAVGRTGNTQVNYTQDHRIGVMPQIAWRPTDHTDLNVRLFYQNDPSSLYGMALPAAGTVLPNKNGKLPTSLFTSEPGFDQYRRTEYMTEIAFRHQFNDALTWRQNFRYLHLDSDFRSISLRALASNQATASRMYTISREHMDAFNSDNSLETRFHTGHVKHTLIAGIDYLHNASDRILGNGTVPSLNLYNPVYGAHFYPTATSDASQILNQLGLYIQDQAKWKRFSFILGGRFDWTTLDTTYRWGGKSVSSSARKPTYRGGIVYSFDNGISPYFSYSTSFMPTAGTSYAGASFKPTTGNQYEVGVKYQPRKIPMTITGSAYTIHQENVLTTDPVHTTYNIQTGAVRSRGFELEARAHPLPGLNLIASYAYNDIQIRHDTTASNIGHRLLAAPSNTASGWVSYTFQNGRAKGFGLGGGVRYNGFTYGDNANSFKVPGYVLGEAEAHYDLGGAFSSLKNLLLQVNATNLADNKYVVACASSINCFYGTRRTILGNIQYRW